MQLAVCHNKYTTGCVSQMIGKLNVEPLNIRRTNRRLTLCHKEINGHLALPIGNLQPCLRRTRHLNSKHTIPSAPAKTATNCLSSRDNRIMGSTPAKMATNFISSRDNRIMEFCTRQNIHYQRTHMSVGQYFNKTRRINTGLTEE